MVVRGLDDPQINMHCAAVRSNGGNAPCSLVIADQVGNIEGGQHIPVGHDEGLIQPIHKRQRTGGAERVRLITVANLQAVLAAVGKKARISPARCPTVRTTSSTPARLSCSSSISRIVLSPMGIIGFGKTRV